MTGAMGDSELFQDFTLEKLAGALYDGKEQEHPPVVLVGAGISQESGGPSNVKLMETLVDSWGSIDTKNKLALASNKQGENWDVYRKALGKAYQATVKGLSEGEVYAAYGKTLLYHGPSTGFARFVQICKRHYFDWIISTNFDPLMEEAFSRGGVAAHDWLKFTRTLMDPDAVARYMRPNYPSPRLKLLKIHGDLMIRRVDATEETTVRFTCREKKKFVPALIDLLSDRDLLVIGHGMEDRNLIELIEKAWSLSGGSRAIWIVAKGAKKGPEDQEKYKQLDDSLRSIWENRSEKGSIRLIDCAFDEALATLDDELRRLEMRPECLRGFQHIHHIVGLGVNKKQLVHLVVAPRHVADMTFGDQYFRKTAMRNDERLRKVDPIYLPGNADCRTFELLRAGLSHQRSDAALHQMSSDLPFVQVVYVPGIRVDWKKGSNDVALSEPDEHLQENPPGVGALSKVLYNIWEKTAEAQKNLGDTQGKTGGQSPLSVYCDPEPGDLGRLLEEQRYKEAGETEEAKAEYLLRTIVALAGHPRAINFVSSEKKTDADIVVSANPDSSGIKVPLHRFFAVPRAGDAFDKLIRGATGNSLLLTLGGPEHNKLLELLIAAHRWSGGQTIFNQSNVFDQEDFSNAFSAGVTPGAVILNTEDFVGGVHSARGSKREERRGKNGSIIVQFSVRADGLEWGQSQTPDCSSTTGRGTGPIPIRVLALVGWSAIGTILAAGYIAFSKEFRLTKNDSIQSIVVPVDDQNLPIGDQIKNLLLNVEPNMQKFLEKYIPYILGEDPKENDISTISKDIVGNLLSPIAPDFCDWCDKNIPTPSDKHDQPLLDATSSMPNGVLWARIVDRFLMTR